MNEREIELIFFNLNKDLKYFDWDAFKRIKIHIGVLEDYFKEKKSNAELVDKIIEIFDSMADIETYGWYEDFKEEVMKLR